MKRAIKEIIKRIMGIFGYELRRRVKEGVQFPGYPEPYLENPESGPLNLELKEERLQEGKPFEWPDMIALNQVVVTLLGDSKKILEVGSGTGCFAWKASKDKERLIVASEMDKAAMRWATRNRSAENIQYVSKPLKEFEEDSFDIVVSVDVIEHIKKYKSFLERISIIAPRAILTTPNKNRNEIDATICPPRYLHHVREWTAGEFYWILRMFYQKVYLYSMPDKYELRCIPVSILSRLTPVIAVCER